MKISEKRSSYLRTITSKNDRDFNLKNVGMGLFLLAQTVLQ
jgi:hypothetical protein